MNGRIAQSPPVASHATCRKLRLIALLLCISWTGTSPVMAQGKVFNIQDFEPVKNTWIGLETTVEGRRSTYDSTLIKLRNTTIVFRPECEMPRLDRKNANLRLTGRLQKENGRLVFAVRAIEEAPGDLDVFASKERDVKRNDAQGWYELANWAEKRGNFYNDQQLLDRVHEARRRGFELERKLLPDNNPEARMQLASKAAAIGLPDVIRQNLIHEALILRRQAVLDKFEEAAESQLIDDIARELPGADKPLASDNGELRTRYLLNPDIIYAQAKANDRPILHRILWTSLAIARIERKIQPDFSNGFEVAAEIDEVAPEFHSHAEKIRDQTLDAKANKVANLSKPDVLKLREDYRARMLPKQGDEVLASWLQWKKKRLAPDDVEGLISLAGLYTELLNQPQTRLQMLLEAAQRHPDSRELKEVLTRMHYRFHENKWITEAEYSQIPSGKLDQALREGRVEVGMTSHQVRKSLGEPSSIIRALSAGQVNEVWSFKSPGSSQPQLIYFIRRIPAVDTTVIGIESLP